MKFLDAEDSSNNKDKFVANEVISAANKIYNFMYLYNNQVDDHRIMLDTLYSRYVSKPKTLPQPQALPSAQPPH